MNDRTPYRPKLGLTVAILSAVGTGSAAAAGFDVPDLDAFAIGRGLAVVATPDNPSAVYYNPAGLTSLPGNNFRAGAYAIDLEPQYQNPVTGAKYGNRDPYNVLPQLFYSYGNQQHGYAVGLGIYVPAGLSDSWPDTTGFRTTGTQGVVEEVAINPVVAYKICDSLSVGAGVSANYANVDLRQGILWPGQPFDQFRFQGDGWGVSGNVGILWQPIKQLSFGAALQTGSKINLNGYTTAYNSVATPLAQPPYYYPTFSTRTDAQADFQFPLKVEGGVSYRPTSKWNVEFDADYIDWHSLGTVNIQQSAAFPPLFPQDIPVAFDWQSSWYYELGVTRYLDNGWHVSAGYIFDQNSVPSAHYNPIATDEDRHYFSVGFGRKGKNFDFDIAYQFGYGPDRTVSGSATSAGGQTADGTYSYLSQAVAISLGWHF